MDPATLAVLLGAVVASSAAGVYTNAQNIKYAQQANEESVELANTAHQREVRDLRAAGLNPILSARGSGADVPQLKTPGLQNPLGDLASSASGIANAINGMTKSEIQAAKADAQSAEHIRDLNGLEAMRSNYSLDADLADATLGAIENSAKLEAVTGIQEAKLHDPESPYYIDWSNEKARKAYRNMVKQHRRELSTGAYNAGRWRSILSDSTAGFFGSASAARDISTLFRGKFKRR